MMSTDNSTQEITLQQYLSLTFDRWRVWVGAGIIAAVLAGMCSLLVVPEQYQATATIVTTGQMGNERESLRAIQALPIQMPGEVRSEAELCRQILETQTVRRQVVEECSLRAKLPGQSTQEIAKSLARRTKVAAKWPNLVTLTVTVPGSPRVSRARLSGREPEAARTAVKVIECYIRGLAKCLSEMHVTAAKRKRVFLEEQKRGMQEDLAEAEEALRGWEARHGIMQLEVAGKAVVEDLVSLQQSQEEARVELRGAKQRVAALQQELTQQPEMETAAVVQQANPLVAKLSERLVELETALAVATKVERKTEQHPEVRAIQQEIGETKEALAEEQERAMLEASRTEVASPTARRLQGDLVAWRVNREALEARIAGLDGAMKRAEAGVAELSGQALEYGRLVRTVKIREMLFETLAEEYEHALLEEQATEPAFHVLDAPVVPERPEGPGLLVRMILAALVGALVGWVWVMGSGERRKHEADEGGEPE